MELYIIKTKNFKELYFRSVCLLLITIVLSFVYVAFGFAGYKGLDPYREWSMPVLWAMVALSVAFSLFQKKQMERVYDLENFEEQVQAYQKVYNQKLMWYLFSCAIMSLMFVLTLRSNFFYFSIVDLIIILFMFPNRSLFRKALRNDELIIS